MDLDDHAIEVFLEVYGTLSRAGPGADEHTLRALDALPGATPQAVLDLGCGPGAQTLALAGALPDAHVLALDLLPTLVATAEDRVNAAGVGERVEVVVGDMAAAPVEPASQDLIWCEGAIYFLGVAEALRTWRPLLRPGGAVAFTEPIWLVDEPDAEVCDWWLSNYPALTDDPGVRNQVEAAGFRTVDSFPLPASAWWDEYYEPMLDRIDELRERRPDDPVAHEVIGAAEAEIDFHRRFSDQYSYAFYVVEPATAVMSSPR